MEEIAAESISSLKAGGLKVLWQGPSPEVDIVAVHGLGANPDWAWVRKVGNSDNKRKRDGTLNSKLVNWLSDLDMLPSKLPNARIMTFNYLSKWHTNAPVQRLALCAEQMLNALDVLRKEEPATDTHPLMLIGHSFGGIVIEQMIVFASGDERYKHISTAIAGVVFLGSPFRGSQATEWAQMIAWTGQKVGVGSSDAILKDLQADSAALTDLRHRFCELLLRRPVPLCCFFEQYQTDYGHVGASNSRLCACLDGHSRWPLPTDHLKLNKFEGPNDQAYIDVSSILVKWVREKLELAKGRTITQNRNLSEDENKCLQDLFLTDPEDDLSAMTRRGQRVTGTCEWILAREEYRRWLVGKKTRLFYLTGDPGIGKTTIAARLTEDLVEKASQDSQITFVYYFCDSKDQNRRTASTVLRGLLLQMLRQRPALFKLVLPEYKQKGKRCFDSFEGLRRMFCSLLDDPSAGKAYILVDALDECEAYSRADLLQCFETIASRSQVILTSRMTIEIEEMELKSQEGLSDTQCPELGPELIHIDPAAINEDLFSFIEAKVEELPARFTTKTKSMVQDALMKRAGGTFIWVSLVLMDISEAKRSDAVLQKLHKLPRDLNEVYARILRDIDEDDVGDARFILQCVTAALRPLTIQELSTARMIGKGYWTKDHAPRRDDILEYKDGWKCCGPILRLDSDGETRTVTLIHQSAKDFLLDNNVECCEKVKSFLFERSVADLSMFNSCRDFLTKNEFDTISTKMFPVRYFCDYELECLSLGPKEHPFLSYCLDHWRDHAIAAKDEVLKRLPCIETWASRRPAILSAWLLLATKHGQVEVVSYLLSRGADVNSWYGLAGPPLSIAVEEDLHDMAQLLIEQPNVNIGDSLEIAARLGNIPIATLILKSQKCDLHDMASSITNAVLSDSVSTIVELLLAQPGVDPDLIDDKDRAPLSYASEAGSEVVMKLLLNQRQIMADRRDSDGRTPLSWAASSGSETCVQLLLSRDDVSFDAPDNFGRTPLSYAAGGVFEQWKRPAPPPKPSECGYERCVSLLLSRNGIDVNSRDASGRTPLSWAATSGNEACVKLSLSRSEVLADSHDSHGRSPLSYSAEEPKELKYDNLDGYMDNIAMREKCMQLLLSRTDVVADSEDHSGRQPLSYASSYEAGTSLVKLLLSRSDVSADRSDKQGAKPSLLAAKYGCESTLRLLLSRNDVVVDHRDQSGVNALMLAARCGNEACMRLLLTHSHIALDSCDHDGRTAFSWMFDDSASDDLAYPCAKLLLSRDCSLAKTCDNRNCTPLHHAAVYFHYHKTLKLLIAQPDCAIDAEDNEGRTPLALTVEAWDPGDLESLHLLVDAGANVNHHSVIAAIRKAQETHVNVAANLAEREEFEYECLVKWPRLLQYLVRRGAKI